MNTRKLLALVAFVSISATAFSQGGVRLGWQNSNVFYSDNVTLGAHRNYFYVGGYNHYNLTEKTFQLHYGAEYLKNGWNENDNNFRELHVISVPLALRMNIGPLFAQAGVGLNFRISEQYEIAGIDILSDANKSPALDYPLQAGVGIKLGSLVLEARYSYGLALAGDDGRVAYFQLGGGLDLF